MAKRAVPHKAFPVLRIENRLPSKRKYYNINKKRK
jgi:hypothetical protein